MTDNAQFEVNTWADAEIIPGPGNPAHPDHAAWLAEQDVPAHSFEPYLWDAARCGYIDGDDEMCGHPEADHEQADGPQTDQETDQ